MYTSFGRRRAKFLVASAWIGGISFWMGMFAVFMYGENVRYWRKQEGIDVSQDKTASDILAAISQANVVTCMPVKRRSLR